MLHSYSMLWPDGLKKALTFSYDDGVFQDEKLIELFRLYGMKATFNLNSGMFGHVYEVTDKRGVTIEHSRLMSEDVSELYSGFEIAVHTSHHPFLTRISPVNATNEILSDRAALEEIAGYPVRGMAYPYGDVNESVKSMVRACGIRYSRGTKTNGGYALPLDPYDWQCSCHHSGLDPLIDPFVENETRLQLLSVWGHSYEFDFDDSWDDFESMLARLANKDDTWYCTNIEMFDYIDAYSSLAWSADASMACNRSSVDVFAEVDGETVRIPAGQTVKTV